MQPEQPPPRRWYEGISRYQWLVLVIASLGWVFDVFEGQIFVASMNEAMPELAPSGSTRGDFRYYENISFAAFLVGGAAGGVLFGWLSDRIGRVRTLVYTILLYSTVTCLSALSQSWWHMALTRFLVGMGTGGEWAVGAALVAEVFPTRARAWSLSIFHGSSVLGTMMAVAAGAFLVPNLGWRAGFVLGAVPALLVLWIRLSLREPPRHEAVVAPPRRTFPDLFQGRLLRNLLLGVSLATVGLATFWGTHIRGKDYLRQRAEAGMPPLSASLTGPEREQLQEEQDREKKRWEMAGMLLTTLGGGLGLFCFGPLADRLGRRGAFLLFHAGGLAAALVLFQLLTEPTGILLFLPVFGFLTLGLHAGYAVYFPELFPTAVRSTGAGFCFNVGRFTAAPILFLFGFLQRPESLGLTLPDAASLMSLLFIAGIALLALAPETRGRELPE